MRLSRDGAWNRIWVYDFSNETIKILKKKTRKEERMWKNIWRDIQYIQNPRKRQGGIVELEMNLWVVQERTLTYATERLHIPHHYVTFLCFR